MQSQDMPDRYQKHCRGSAEYHSNAPSLACLSAQSHPFVAEDGLSLEPKMLGGQQNSRKFGLSTLHHNINLPSTYHPHLTTGPPGLHRSSSGPVAPHRPLSRLAAPGSSAPELPRPHLSRHLSIGNLNLPDIPKLGQLWMAGWLIAWNGIRSCVLPNLGLFAPPNFWNAGHVVSK